MRKRGRNLQSRKRASSEQQLVGLRTRAQAQKQNTVKRLEAAIASLKAQSKPVSARTIREECGLEYTSIRRNPEALLLYQQNSAYLKQKRKRTKETQQTSPVPRDPLLAYKKIDLITRLRAEQVRCAGLEGQHADLLQEYIQRDMRIAELEAELARYREYFEQLRITSHQQEHQG